MMSRVTSVVFILLSLAIVNSGDNNLSYKNNNNTYNKHSRTSMFNSPLSATNRSNIHSTRVVNHPMSSIISVPDNKPTEEATTQPQKQEEQQQQPQQKQQQQVQKQQQQMLQQREKRATANFELDEAEIARQNQITQQIFAKYLERRLFPNRSTNERIPTISEILPKTSTTTTTTARPRSGGLVTSSILNNLRRNKSLRTPGSKRYGNDRLKQNKRLKGGAQSQQLLSQNDDDEEEDEQQDAQSTLQKPEFYDDITADGDGVTYDGQESLQSVESKQHDHYYNDVFNRDPRDNEIDSDCPNCVDESLYTNKWTMPLLKLGEKRYYLGIFFKANWFKAAQYCRYHGMHLASISSQEENDRLEKHIRDFEGLGHEHFWTSGTDLADEGNYFWMANGRPITFTNWNAGEPNNFRYENGEEENCMELWNRDGKGLKWNDSPCSFETYFVCEVQAM